MTLSLSGDASYLVSCTTTDSAIDLHDRGACWVFMAEGGSYKQLGTKIVSGLPYGGWFGEYEQKVAKNVDV